MSMDYRNNTLTHSEVIFFGNSPMGRGIEIKPCIIGSYSLVLSDLQKEEIKFGKIKKYLGSDLFFKLTDSQKDLIESTVGSIDLGFAPNYKGMFSPSIIGNGI